MNLDDLRGIAVALMLGSIVLGAVIASQSKRPSIVERLTALEVVRP